MSKKDFEINEEEVGAYGGTAKIPSFWATHKQESIMYLFISFGTVDFLEKLKSKYVNEDMVEFYNDETAILLHETSKKKSVFSAPQKYEVITTHGHFEKAGFVVLKYVPVTEEGKPLFEFKFANQNDLFKYVPGIVGLRILRPTKSDTYVIVTFWNQETSYKNWVNSASFTQFKQMIEDTKAENKSGISSGISYTKSFYALQESEG